ncbi:pyridoxal phosphate-dependent transferase [Aspergillus insuetus]
MTRLQVTEIESLRANCLPLPLTAAPATSSEQFKSPHGRGNPLARRWDHHFSTESRYFQGSALKKASSPVGPRKIISLGTGRPTADYYPWQSLTFHGVSAAPLASKTAANGLGHSVHTLSKRDASYNLSLGLNYGHAAGSPHLLRFVTEHVELVHNPPYRDWSTFLSCGATAALEVAFRIFCNRGDWILTEQWTYPGTLESAMLNGVRVYGVEMDADGLRPDCLESTLSSWNTSSQGPRPRVLYTIPTGQNPTGYTQPAERRAAIYAIAEKYDLIIIEDDPYYFLPLGPYLRGDTSTTGGGVQSSNACPKPVSRFPNSEPSYLSLDTSGRIIRLDSTSKTLAPGLRVGWVTASAQIINKFLAYQEVSTVAVSGPSQLMLWSLLDQTWGHDGLASWLAHLSGEYQWRRSVLLRACERYLPLDITSWIPPRYGMFLWIKVDWRGHPGLKSKVSAQAEELNAQLQALEARITDDALSRGVLVTRGSLFSWNKRPNGELHFRMTFAAASEGDLEEGVRLFGETLAAEFLPRSAQSL